MISYELYHGAKLRVFSVIPGIGGGGAELWWSYLLRHACTVRHHAFLCMNQTHSEIYKSVAGIPHRFVNSDEPWKIREVGIELLKEVQGADIILSWGLGEQVNEFLAHANLPSIQCSHSESSLNENSPHAAYRRYLESLKGGNFNFLSGVSKSACHLWDKNKVAQCEPKVIHNGVEIDRCIPGRPRRYMRQMLNIPQEAKVVLFNGRLIPEKNPDVAVEALYHLGPEWHMIFNGHGEKQLLDRCVSLSQGLQPSAFGLPGRVLFLKPFLNGINDLMGCSDVQVIPSQTEAFPYTWIEPWVAGTRMIATDIPTLQELFDTYNDGKPWCEYIKRPATAKELARQIMDDQGLVPKAQSIAMASFNASRCVGLWEQYIHSCHSEWHSSSLCGQLVWSPTKGNVNAESHGQERIGGRDMVLPHEQEAVCGDNGEVRNTMAVAGGAG